MSAGRPFRTTVIGSMPKPAWLVGEAPLGDAASRLHGSGAGWRLTGRPLRDAQDDAVRLAVHDQIRAGIDVISDGEQRRSSYLTYVTARLSGFDYTTLARKWTRNRRRLAEVGRCVGPVRRTAPILADDLRFLLAESDRPVKVTLPGPMTVVDSTQDEHYGDEEAMAMAVAAALDQEARELDGMGAAVIQFDEPVFSRYPEKVRRWGIEALDRAAVGIRHAASAVHVCYSYPMPGVPRPIVDSYPVILAELERSRVAQVSLEFAAAGLDPELLRRCPSKTVLYGCISNGTDEVESPEEVAGRLLAAAAHLPAERIQAAPDCGLVPLSPPVARAKLRALAAGAALARERLRD